MLSVFKGTKVTVTSHQVFFLLEKPTQVLLVLRQLSLLVHLPPSEHQIGFCRYSLNEYGVFVCSALVAITFTSNKPDIPPLIAADPALLLS